MKVFTLKRIAENENGTFGVLLDENDPFCLTLERKWVNNQPDVSCIPSSEYIARRVVSPKFGDTYEVVNVPFRTDILFHKGNVMENSHGCIILADDFAIINGMRGVGNSGLAFQNFMDRLKGEAEFRLIIVRA